MATVAVSTSSRTTMVLNFDPPQDLLDVLNQYANETFNTSGQLPDEILVTVGNVRVGKINLYSREWRNKGVTQY